MNTRRTSQIKKSHTFFYSANHAIFYIYRLEIFAKPSLDRFRASYNMYRGHQLNTHNNTCSSLLYSIFRTSCPPAALLWCPTPSSHSSSCSKHVNTLPPCDASMVSNTILTELLMLQACEYATALRCFYGVKHHPYRVPYAPKQFCMTHAQSR